MPSHSQPIERCRPLLGTFVGLRVSGLAPGCARAVLDAAFSEIAAVHRLMSFHEPESDVSRMNRAAHREPVVVDIRTIAVLRRAVEISIASGGAFDVTVAQKLVAGGKLPAPPNCPPPDPHASWRDIELRPGRMVRFKRPLWIDLGGIAKGFAVDQAMALIGERTPQSAVVNAGGDLKVVGLPETILLSPGDAAVALQNGSVASSEGTMDDRSVHIATVGEDRGWQFVSVTAPDCMDADALTKVVMAQGPAAAPVLERYAARALLKDFAGWHAIGAST